MTLNKEHSIELLKNQITTLSGEVASGKSFNCRLLQQNHEKTKNFLNIFRDSILTFNLRPILSKSKFQIDGNFKYYDFSLCKTKVKSIFDILNLDQIIKNNCIFFCPQCQKNTTFQSKANLNNFYSLLLNQIIEIYSQQQLIDKITFTNNDILRLASSVDYALTLSEVIEIKSLTSKKTYFLGTKEVCISCGLSKKKCLQKFLNIDLNQVSILTVFEFTNLIKTNLPGYSKLIKYLELSVDLNLGTLKLKELPESSINLVLLNFVEAYTEFNNYFVILDHLTAHLGDLQVESIIEILSNLDNFQGILICDNNLSLRKISNTNLTIKSNQIEVIANASFDQKIFSSNIAKPIKLKDLGMLETLSSNENKVISLICQDFQSLISQIKLINPNSKTIILEKISINQKNSIAKFLKLDQIFSEFLSKTADAKIKGITAKKIISDFDCSITFKNYNLEQFLDQKISAAYLEFKSLPSLFYPLNLLSNMFFDYKLSHNLQDLSYNQIVFLSLIKILIKFKMESELFVIYSAFTTLINIELLEDFFIKIKANNVIFVSNKEELKTKLAYYYNII